jgi:hypothetical protein
LSSPWKQRIKRIVFTLVLGCNHQNTLVSGVLMVLVKPAEPVKICSVSLQGMHNVMIPYQPSDKSLG